jgi:hypothetical protein
MHGSTRTPSGRCHARIWWHQRRNSSDQTNRACAAAGEKKHKKNTVFSVSVTGATHSAEPDGAAPTAEKQRKPAQSTVSDSAAAAAAAMTAAAVVSGGGGGTSAAGSAGSAEAEAEDEVEAILDVQNDVAGNLVYLIKWKGQDESQNTWEPEAHLTNCSELLAGFRERRRNARLIKIKMPTAPAGASSSSADAKAGEKVPSVAGGARTPFRIKLRVGSHAAADADADEFEDIEDDDVDEYSPHSPACPSLSQQPNPSACESL